MKIKFLGAHNLESKKTSCTCFLIDDVLAVDAGALTANLSFREQQKLKAVLITHRHYDHIKDIPALGINCSRLEKQLDIYTTRPVYDDLADYLLDGYLYPDFREMPPEKPAFKFSIIEAGREVSIGGYKALPVEVNHTVPTVGFQFTSPDGKKLFYTSDTGSGLDQCWRRVSPDLLIIETTYINKYQNLAAEAGHLTPSLLKTELEDFRKHKGYLPRIITVHANPMDEKEMEEQLAGVAADLNADIQPGREGMIITL